MAQFNCCGLFCVVREGNIPVLQYGESLEGWQMGGYSILIGLAESFCFDS